MVAEERVAEKAVSLLARIDAAIEDAGRMARVDDPAAHKILDVVGALLARGQSSLACRTVALHADLPPSTVRALFPTRAALLRGFFRRSRLSDLGAMRAAMTQDESGDHVSEVVALYAGMLADPIGLSVGRRRIELWAEACRSPDALAELAERQRFWADLVEHLVEADIGEGRPPFSPTSITRLLLACFDGLVVASTLLPEQDRSDQIAATALALWRGVRAFCGGAELASPSAAPLARRRAIAVQ